MYFHLNLQLSRSFKQDFVWTIMKFRKYSLTLELKEFEGFMKYLIQNSNLNHSKIVKYVAHLRIFFKDCCLVQDSKLDNLNVWAQSYLVKSGISSVSLSIISKMYKALRKKNFQEEALFLYLTYSLGLHPRCLWFLKVDSVVQNNILTYWDPAREQEKEIILCAQTKKKL